MTMCFITSIGSYCTKPPSISSKTLSTHSAILLNFSTISWWRLSSLPFTESFPCDGNWKASKNLESQMVSFTNLKFHLRKFKHNVTRRIFDPCETDTARLYCLNRQIVEVHKVT